MSALRVLSSGVDGFEATARGPVRNTVWNALERAKLEAQQAKGAVPFQFGSILRPLLVLPYGRRGWPYWLTSPDFEMGLGRNQRGVPVYVQLHSAYLHSLGPELAVGLLGTLLQVDVMSGPFQLIGSRVDVYADVQGWEFELTDIERFASRGRVREPFPIGGERGGGVHMAGRRVTGFRFGRDAVVARIYDKTAEIKRRSVSWLPDLWGEREEDVPVWRVEFQLRRRAIAEFNVTEFDEVLASVQDFWEHCTKEFLTLRMRTGNRQRARWPLDPTWAEVQAVEIAPTRTGVIRRRLVEGNEEMTVRGLQGGLTSWAAIHGYEDLDRALKALRPRLTRYWKGLGRTFRDEVRHKRSRLLWLTGPEDVSEERKDDQGNEECGRWSGDGRPSGHSGGTVPRIGRSARTARRARVPEGSEPNRDQGGRGDETTGSGRRRRRVRDGGDGGGSARQGSKRTGRVSGGGRAIPKPRRGQRRRLSVSSDATDGAGEL
ncbi:MAG: hypothetical protein E6J41_15735 [Chloroflexi bacterium]|nr:MAG: hypothetical protein E6J41_15735 [Chloroflexota bacterium]